MSDPVSNIEKESLRDSRKNPRQIPGIIAASIHDRETVRRLADRPPRRGCILLPSNQSHFPTHRAAKCSPSLQASLHDTLAGKIKAWSATEPRQSKRIKDLGDISRLVESHTELWDRLPPEL